MSSKETDSRPAWNERTVPVVLIIVLLALMGVIAAIPVQLPTDGHEYLGSVASVIETHNLKFEREDILAAARLVSPETFLLDTPYDYNTKENPWTGERMWGSHSVYVSFIALPFVLLFKAKGFLVLNALCFAGILWILHRHFSDSNKQPVALALALACILLSGVPSYVFWVNSEMLLMLCLFGAIYLGLRFRVYWAVILLGVATAIKPPLVLVFFPLALWHFVHRRSIKTVLLMGLLYSATLAPHLLYDALALGRLGPIQLAGRAAEAIPTESGGNPSLFRHMTPLRLWAFWLGPGTGLLWFYPAVFWCTYRNRYPWWMAACFVATALLISVICIFPVNLISTGDGIRYATLVFPLFFFLAGKWKSSRLDWALMAASAFLGGGLLIDATHSIRTPEWVYAKPLPSMVPAERWGVPIYPELLFHVGQRYPRDVAIDYADDQNMLRNNVVQIMMRNAQPGEAILRLLPVPDAETTNVQFGAIGEQFQEKEVPPGRVTTLFAPLPTDVLKKVSYPEWRKRSKKSALTARLRLRFSRMNLFSGTGQLRWQERYHGGDRKFVCQAAAQLLSVYPSRAWILSTVAAEDFADTTAMNPIEVMNVNRPDVKVGWASDSFIEGRAALRIEAIVDSNTGPAAVVMKEAVSLTEPPSEELAAVEVSGFVRFQPEPRNPDDKTKAKGAVIIEWLGADGAAIKRDPAVAVTEQSPSEWQYFAKALAIPKNAVSARLEFNIEGRSATLGLDGLVLSWYKGLWD